MASRIRPSRFGGFRNSNAFSSGHQTGRAALDRHVADRHAAFIESARSHRGISTTTGASVPISPMMAE